ncbi:MAG: hypothetical protein QOF43_577, partial [Gaiellaceae bacterium]|nr:hypothetical protein [Gaiellaceae bacterium]
LRAEASWRPATLSSFRIVWRGIVEAVPDVVAADTEHVEERV